MTVGIMTAVASAGSLGPFFSIVADGEVRVNSGLSNEASIVFNPAGNRFLTAESNDLFQLTCSTAFEVSTGSGKVNSLQNVNSGGGLIGPRGGIWSPDGTKVLVASSTTGGRVFQMNCSVAGDATSISSVNSVTTLTSGDYYIGLATNSSGTKFYVINFNDSTIEEWNFGSSWNLSGASFSRAFTCPKINNHFPSDLALDPVDNQYLMLVYNVSGTNTARLVYLDTPGDLSSAVDTEEEYDLTAGRLLGGSMGISWVNGRNKLAICGGLSDSSESWAKDFNVTQLF